MGLAFVRVASGRRRVRSGDDPNPVSDQSRRVTERGKSPEPGAKKDELSLKGGDAERTAETERDRGRAAETPSEVPVKGWKFDQLSEIVDAVGDKIDVILDGGIRRGTHVVKALAAGAKACSGGRMYLYAARRSRTARR